MPAFLSAEGYRLGLTCGKPAAEWTHRQGLRNHARVKSQYRTRTRLWRYQGAKASWFFLTLPRKLADEIRVVDAGPRRGMLRVQATIGGTTWNTSIFPAAREQTYLLPVKAQVRKAEGLKVGKTVELRLEVDRAW